MVIDAKMLVQIISTLVPILLAIIGAYVKLKVQISVLQNDVDNLALMLGTKRAKGEKLKRENN